MMTQKNDVLIIALRGAGWELLLRSDRFQAQGERSCLAEHRWEIWPDPNRWGFLVVDVFKQNGLYDICVYIYIYIVGLCFSCLLDFG